MAWIDVPGLAGKVYVPADAGKMHKKYPCQTCFACQWCDENRCRVCRGDHAEAVKPESSPRCNRRLTNPAKTHYP